jgi:hypothetical protein
MKKTWQPIVAGILGILSGLYYFIPFITIPSVYEHPALEEREAAFIAGFIIILFSPLALLPVVAGICALVRRAWLLALVCLSIFSLFQGMFLVMSGGSLANFYPFGILGCIIGIIMPLAAILPLLESRDEFPHGEAGEGKTGLKPRCEICGEEFRKHEMAYPDIINGKSYTSVHWKCLSEETRQRLTQRMIGAP